MERLTLDDIDTWLLSGKPVVRLQGRDFGQSVGEYVDHLTETCMMLRLSLAIRTITDPPGAVLQAYLGPDVPELEMPLLKVTKADTPWLFCIFPKCRNRVSTPGMVCEGHQ